MFLRKLVFFWRKVMENGLVFFSFFLYAVFFLVKNAYCVIDVVIKGYLFHKLLGEERLEDL